MRPRWQEAVPCRRNHRGRRAGLLLKVQDLSPYAWTAFCRARRHGRRLLDLACRCAAPMTSWTWLDGWAVCAIEVVASIICIVRGLDKNPGRAAPLALGLEPPVVDAGRRLLDHRVTGWQDAGGTFDRRHLLPRFLPAGVRRDRAIAANGHGPTVTPELARRRGRRPRCGRDLCGVRLPQHLARRRWQCRDGGDQPGLPDRRPPACSRW